MSESRPSPSVRIRRMTLGLALGLGFPLGLFWMAPGATSGTTMGFIQVPSDAPRITAEQVYARFPKAKHEEFMRRAIANSRKAGVEYKTGGAFGAVIVDASGTVIADGMNHVVAQNDPTWHGEMHAIRQACALLKKPKLEGCILYTSSEPCPMCLATAYWAGVDGILYGAKVEDSKKYGNFDDEFIYAQFASPAKDRAISQQSLLRDEAVEVWKEYHNRKDKVDY
ncbi:nucleoside deaminase [Paludisphaera rhizosphaerae]|uniref:nucleoside deaminase n=1 Tax=Paludisphaera rhizosphaerae TaxID=2711216 RepID=UPI001981CB84|nr:nucleoside deaminase [Paludisphaera rhizosphaerae]